MAPRGTSDGRVNGTAHPSPVDDPWSPEYERLTIHFSSCPTCTAVDEGGANRNLPCAEGARVHAEYRQTRRGA